MLTQQSYVIAMSLYLLAAVVGIRILVRALPDSWPMAIRGGIAGLLGGFLMTPALPSESAETMAPALVVVIFNSLFAGGVDTAVPALGLMIAATLPAVLVGAVIGHLMRSRQSNERSEQEA